MFVSDFTQFYNFNLLWILLVLVSFYELGRIFSYFFYPAINKSIGDRLTLGTLINLLIGGMLLLFNIPTKKFLIIISILLFCIFFFRNTKKIFFKKKYIYFKINNFFRISNIQEIFLIFIIIINTHVILYNNLDDFTGYFPIVEQILANGNMNQEFSYRKVLHLGGHQYLQAFFSSALTDTEYFAVENILSIIIIYFTLQNFIKKNINEKYLFYFYFLLLIFGITFIKAPTVSTTSIISSIALLIFLILKINEFNNSKNHSKKYIILFALTISGLLTLKTNNIVFIFYLFLFLFLFNNKLKFKDRLLTSIYIGLFSLLCVFPWLIIQYKINKTILYPLFDKNTSYPMQEYFRSDFSFSKIDFEIVENFLFNDYFLSNFLIFMFILSLIYLINKDRSIALTFFCYFFSIITIYIGTFNYQMQTPRYIYPLTISLYIFTFYLVYVHLYKVNKKIFFSLTLILLIPLLLKTNFLKRTLELKNELYRTDFIIQNKKVRLLFNDKKYVASYKYLQELTKENSKILVADDTPTIFNFKRNKILVVDYPGFVSPNFSMPQKIESNLFVNYLLKNNIYYIIKILDDYAYPEFFNTNKLEQKIKVMGEEHEDYKFYQTFFIFNENIRKIIEDPLIEKVYSGHLVLVKLKS